MEVVASKTTTHRSKWPSSTCLSKTSQTTQWCKALHNLHSTTIAIIAIVLKDSSFQSPPAILTTVTPHQCLSLTIMANRIVWITKMPSSSCQLTIIHIKTIILGSRDLNHPWILKDLILTITRVDSRTCISSQKNMCHRIACLNLLCQCQHPPWTQTLRALIQRETYLQLQLHSLLHSHLWIQTANYSSLEKVNCLVLNILRLQLTIQTSPLNSCFQRIQLHLILHQRTLFQWV